MRAILAALAAAGATATLCQAVAGEPSSERFAALALALGLSAVVTGVGAGGRWRWLGRVAATVGAVIAAALLLQLGVLLRHGFVAGSPLW